MWGNGVTTQINGELDYSSAFNEGRECVADMALRVADLCRRWNWEVLFHPLYSPNLSLCDDLIPKMDELLRGNRFRIVPEILQAVDRSMRNIYRTVAATEIRVPHRWQ